MSKLKIVDRRSEESIMSERNLLSSLSHSFIVNMYFAFQDFYNLYLVMDLLTGGDLRYHIAHKRTFSESETKFFISNMIIALEYIHSKNIIHRDIKPENLVLESNGYLRITDFGVAKINEKDNSSETSGTPGYMAPEVILVWNHSFPSDFFALGVIGYEFMLGYRPYLGRSRKEIKQLIINQQAKLNKEDIPDSWSLDVMDFINKLLMRKPEERLGYNGIFELKNHPWMKEIDWEKIEAKKIQPPFLPPTNEENYDKNYCEGEDDIGEETIERYQIYAQSELFPEVFKNYTFCNLSYISNYHIKRLKRFKENKKIKDIVEKNVNKVLSEQKELITKKNNKENKNEEIEKNNTENNKLEEKNIDVNNLNHSINNKENNNDTNRQKGLSKSVEDIQQIKKNIINKENETISNNIETKEELTANKNEINYKKEDKNKEFNTINHNINDILNNQINNTNGDFCTIETNKTRSKSRRKISCKKNQLSKSKSNKRYIKNFKENIIYNNYINLHFNNFSNKNNNNNNNINVNQSNNINGESTASNKKTTTSKHYSKSTKKTKSTINIISNLKFKNKKNIIGKSSSMKNIKDNKNMFNHILSPYKDGYKNKNKINVKIINREKSKNQNHENKNETKKNKNNQKTQKKLDYKNLNKAFNKKFQLFLNVINYNSKININNKIKSKKTERTINRKSRGSCNNSCGIYTDKKILTPKKKKTPAMKLSKKYRSLSMYDISNNNNFNLKNKLNYNTLNANSIYSISNPKNSFGLFTKNKKYNIFSSSKSTSKSKSKDKNLTKPLNNKKILSNHPHKKNDKIKSQKNSFDYKNNKKLIQSVDSDYLSNKRNEKKNTYNSNIKYFKSL